MGRSVVYLTVRPLDDGSIPGESRGSDFFFNFSSLIESPRATKGRHFPRESYCNIYMCVCVAFAQLSLPAPRCSGLSSIKFRRHFFLPECVMFFIA